jgi:hypothetical protein
MTKRIVLMVSLTLVTTPLGLGSHHLPGAIRFLRLASCGTISSEVKDGR